LVPWRGPALQALCVALVLGGPHIAFLHPTVFEEVVHWSGTFAAYFVLQAVRGIFCGFSRAILCRMGVAAGLALLTRVSTGIGLSAAIGGLILGLAWHEVMLLQVSDRFAWIRSAGRVLILRFWLPVAALLALVALTLAVNWARWGNPLVFVDIRDQVLMNQHHPDRLTLLNATGEFNPSRIWYGLLYYFVPIWPMRGADGGLLFEAFQRRMVEAELPPASFLLSDPLLLVLASGFVRRASGLAVAIAAGLAVPVVMMLSFAFMDYRYREEFYPLLVFAAAVALAGAPAPRPSAVAAWGLSAISILFAHSFLLFDAIAFEGPADVGMVREFFESLGF